MRTVILEVFQKDILAGEITLPGTIRNRFPEDRPCGMGWSSPDGVPQVRAHTNRNNEVACCKVSSVYKPKDWHWGDQSLST